MPQRRAAVVRKNSGNVDCDFGKNGGSEWESLPKKGNQQISTKLVRPSEDRFVRIDYDLSCAGRSREMKCGFRAVGKNPA